MTFINYLVRRFKSRYYRQKIDDLLDQLESLTRLLMANERSYKTNRDLSLKQIKEYFQIRERYAQEWMDLSQVIDTYPLSLSQLVRYSQLTPKDGDGWPGETHENR